MSITWIASFDIGKKNFSFYIEEFDSNIIKSLKNIPKQTRFNNNGTPTPTFNNILTDIYKTGTKILLENVDLTHGCNPKSYLDINILYNMTNLLDKYSNYWDQCDIFVIEKQMSFGKNYNTMALKLGQHCWSYFALRYPMTDPMTDPMLEIPIHIVEFPAYYKTQILGAAKIEKHNKSGKISYKAVDKPTRKKWCITKALDILNLREDISTTTIITKSKKKDDLCDVICQLQAFKYCYFIDKCLE
jgi:hypothetical protein